MNLTIRARLLLVSVFGCISSLIVLVASTYGENDALIACISTAILQIVLGVYLGHRLVGALRAIIKGLQDTMEQVSNGVNQISRSSQSLAQTATQQAASLEETAASLEEISSVAHQNAGNSQQANNLSSEVQATSESGVKAMLNMADAINAIKQSADETAGIVKTIDEIAFQTNLLALNAAVEAARAGDAGKGFAVVAEEVRALAQRSGNAAKDTAEKIKRSRELADNGVRVSSDVSKSLEGIKVNVTRSGGLVKEIAAASNEQATSISQVNTAVSQLDQVTQQNSASAEQLSAAANQLQAQSRIVGDIVETLSGIIYGASAVSKGESGGRDNFDSALFCKSFNGGGASSGEEKSSIMDGKISFNKHADNRTHAAVNADNPLLRPSQIIPLDDNDFKGF